jgi:hypothetical protein
MSYSRGAGLYLSLLIFCGHIVKLVVDGYPLLIASHLYGHLSFPTTTVPRLFSTFSTGDALYSPPSLSQVTVGNMIEHSSLKGSRLVALVTNRTGSSIEVLNDAKKTYLVPFNRVTFNMQGKFLFGDLIRLNDQVFDLKPQMVHTHCSTIPLVTSASVYINLICFHVDGCL